MRTYKMSKKDYVIDSDENSDYMYDIIADTLNEVGPRGSCTKEEKAAAELLAEKLNPICDDLCLSDPH